MEVYAPLYRRNLKKSLIRVKRIQEILGDLHDCDVWIDTVMAMLPTERSSRKMTPPPGYGRNESDQLPTFFYLTGRRSEHVSTADS